MVGCWGGRYLAEPVYVVGVGGEGGPSLTPRALSLIQQAEVLVGGERLLALFPDLPAHRVAVRAGLDEVIEQIRTSAECSRVVVLASGDPGFYGIARPLAAALGKERLEIIPNVSSIQLAFARIGESWDDALLLSVHARPIVEVVQAIADARKVALLTDGQHTPSAVAQALLDHGIDGFRAYVCENLGAPDERVVETDLTGLVGREFAPLNVLLLLRDAAIAPSPYTERGMGGEVSPPLAGGEGQGEGALPLFGLPDEAFHQQRPPGGLITKSEVRAVALARLRLREDSVVWDIGAGSGAVAVEAARLARRGEVFAVERNPAAGEDIQRNAIKFAVPQVKVVQAEAPEGLAALPAPDAVFVGGSGGRLADILAVVCHRLRPGGRVVVNVATLENLSGALEALRSQGYVAEVAQVSVARSRSDAGLTRLQALNPVFIVTGERKGDARE